MLGGYKMAAFNTIEEALEDLRRGKIILVKMMRTEKTKEILFVQRNLQPQKILISWQHMERD